MTTALVSVLMTAYNRELYIAEAIESVLASTYKNFELIIVDDCSKDKTVEIIKSYECLDNRIRFYQNEKNLKDYPNRNKAASYATGMYIMHVDSDDMILKDSIYYCVTQMQQNASADFGMSIEANTISPKLMNSFNSVNYHFFTNPFLTIGPGSTIIKRSFFESINRFPILYGPANDMYFNLKVATNGNILILDKPLLIYRIHDGQEQNNKFSYLYNGYNYLRDALAELPFILTEQQKSFLIKKNKRRFTVNIIKFFFTKFDLKKTLNAIQLAKFRFRDFLKGIFHFG